MYVIQMKTPTVLIKKTAFCISIGHSLMGLEAMIFLIRVEHRN